MVDKSPTYALALFSLRAWALQYKRFLVLFVLIFLLMFSVGLKMFFRSESASKDFLSVKEAYAKWVNHEDDSDKSLQTLKAAFKKHPELCPFYEGGVVQTLLALGKEKEAESMISHLFSRTGKSLNSYYMRFAQGSLLIEKGNKDKALFESIVLKEDMLADQEFLAKQAHFGSTLFAFNLLRIAMLSQSLNDGDKELAAWQEFKKYAGWEKQEGFTTPINQEAFDGLLSYFTDQQLSLKDYIKYRENIMSISMVSNKKSNN